MSVARSGSLPADSLLGSPMDFSGQLRPSGACHLLGVPGLGSLDVDDDEGDIVIGIRPKSSPLPRRKSSLSDEDDLELVPPLSGSRRVSFADAAGLDLVQVKEFDIWDVPKLPDYDPGEGREKDSEEYFISPANFSRPLPAEELFAKVRDQKVALETVELLPGTTILRGVIRVLNVSFGKAVYVRTSLDSWSSHFDLLAEYVPGSSEGLMDCFSFRLTLIPPFGEQGARVDFCLRYETPVGTFWANNDSRNYTLFCHRRAKEEVERPPRESVKKKSCLKTVSQNFPSVENIPAVEAACLENNRTDVSKQGEEDVPKAKETFDEQSGTSEGDDQLLPTKTRRSISRRSRRKAARLARVRDYFSQSNGSDDPEKDGPPSETKQKSSAECQLVSDVLQGTPPGRGDNSNNHAEKSESVDSFDLSDTPIEVLQSRDEPSTENQNISGSKSGVEENTQKEDICHGSRHDSASEPPEGLVSAASSDSFTFGTVVAPLYRQAFVSADQGNTAQNVDDERQGGGWATPKDANDSINDAPVPCTDDSETSQRRVESLQVSDQVIRPNQTHTSQTIPAESEEHPNTAGISRTDVLDALILAEGSDLQGRQQENDVTSDLRPQITAETSTQVQSKTEETQGGTKESLDTLKSSEFSERDHETEQEEDKDEVVEDLSPKATLESFDPCPETLDGKDTTELQGSQEEVESLKYEDVIGFCSAEAEEFKNWEMMVEEDEMTLLTDDEEISIQAGDIEAVEEDDIEQVEDTGRETSEATVEEEEKRQDDEMEDEVAIFPKEEQVEDQNQETAGEDIEQFEDTGRETVLELKDATAEEELVMSKETEDEAETVPAEEEQVGDQIEETAREEDDIQQVEDAGIETVLELKDATAEEETEDEAETVPEKEKQVRDQVEETSEEEEVTDQGTREMDRDFTGTLADLEFHASPEIEETKHVEGDERLDGVRVEDGSSAQLSGVKETTDVSETLQTATKDDDGSTSADRAQCVSYDKLDDDETTVGSASSDSDSDDEVELYMHCLRAVHTGPQVGKDSGFGTGRRSSGNRSKLLSSPMPSISESVDEEQNVAALQEDFNESEEFSAVESEGDNLSRVSWWRETFSCRNIGKAFLYAALFLLFLVVAHHYDFLACFGLYLMSLVWLWFQGERQKVNSSKRIS
ncbi:uncharacterized protein ppp1r3ab [Halichoeres trimaculatus]|uniref:uncharacterized protein ppp1r3ab n=1 Tax=Halichoeres trimaculatus TaxID=147232 RepID=UPI003D9E8322